MWVSYDLFDNGIVPGWIRIRAAVSQAMVRQIFQFGFEMTLLVMEKALAVCDEILKVPQLWPVHCGIVDFGDDAVPKSKPDPAGSCISSSHAILPSMCPFGLNARPTKGRRLIGFVRGAHFPDSIALIFCRQKILDQKPRGDETEPNLSPDTRKAHRPL